MYEPEKVCLECKVIMKIAVREWRVEGIGK
jgi:hypothetical protein